MPAVLVVGASGGIGQALCREFARAGWRVGVHYHRNRSAAERTAAEVQGCGGEPALVQADIRDAAAVSRMVEEIGHRCGRLDVLLVAAGVAARRLLIRCDPQTWREVIDTNLTGAFHCLQAAARLMVAQREGAMLLLGSYAGCHGRPGQAAYAASKAGLVGLTRAAAREWGAANVRVNLILPGWHATALAGDAIPAPDGLGDHLLGRTPSREAIARAVYGLAILPDASGQVWNLDSRVV